MERRMRFAAIGVAVMAWACGVGVAQTAAGSGGSQSSALGVQITALVAEPAVVRAHWGVYVTELDGTPIFGLNEGQFFQPASTAKLFTTAAALALMGGDRRFETNVWAEGTLSDGTLRGDLRLVGGGDPDFGTADIPYVEPSERPKGAAGAPLATIKDIEELADKVYAAGVRVVKGDVVGFDTQFAWEPYPPDWSLDDLVYGYGAPVSALSIHDNEIEVKVLPGDGKAKPALKIEPDFPYYEIENKVFGPGYAAGQSCDARLVYRREQGTKHLLVFGDIAGGQCSQNVAIGDPAEYAAMALKAALERRGVRVTGTAKAFHSDMRQMGPVIREEGPGVMMFVLQALKQPYVADREPQICNYDYVGHNPPEPTATVLATHDSPRLSEDVEYTLKTSQNLHAEIEMRDLGASFECKGTQSFGVAAVREFLLNVGIDGKDFAFFDGSGLSGHDLVTPRAEAKLLSYAVHDPKTGERQPWFADWKASLPVGGVDGSLEGRFTKAPLKGHVFAKTGTLGEARALSGYLECASGRTVIFSIMDTSHMPGNADRDVMDRIVAAIAAAE
jgi:D-alanyl-D-alanine carboxypeptidase/D-alanyl-D-alanine-endopeptidase (penicillin-binding protein 4)